MSQDDEALEMMFKEAEGLINNLLLFRGKLKAPRIDYVIKTPEQIEEIENKLHKDFTDTLVSLLTISRSIKTEVLQ